MNQCEFQLEVTITHIDGVYDWLLMVLRQYDTVRPEFAYCTLDMNRLIETGAAAGSAAGCCCRRPCVRSVRGAPSFRAHQTFWAGGAEYVTGSGPGAVWPLFSALVRPRPAWRGAHATEERLDGAGGRGAQGSVRAAAGAAGPAAEGRGVGSHRGSAASERRGAAGDDSQSQSDRSIYSSLKDLSGDVSQRKLRHRTNVHLYVRAVEIS
jgi:hypothetical protein